MAPAAPLPHHHGMVYLAQYHLPRQALTCTSYNFGRAHIAEAPVVPLSPLTADTTTLVFPSVLQSSRSGL